jgi:hypothetical protein
MFISFDQPCTADLGAAAGTQTGGDLDRDQLVTRTNGVHATGVITAAA